MGFVHQRAALAALNLYGPEPIALSQKLRMTREEEGALP
jgi:hypothetical protein